MRRTFVVLGMVAAFALAGIDHAAAQVPVQIRAVVPDTNNRTLTIAGSGFGTAPTVRLAGTFGLIVLNVNAPGTLITAVLPPLLPGSYRVTVTRTGSVPGVASIDFTFAPEGAVGPAGPPGPPGPAGTIAFANQTCAGGSSIFGFDVAGAPLCTPVSVTPLGAVQILSFGINGSGPSMTVLPGATVTLTMRAIFTPAGCPGCVVQFYVGIEGAPFACPIPVAVEGQQQDVTVTLTAPSTRGVYSIRGNWTWDFGCVGVNSADLSKTLGILRVI